MHAQRIVSLCLALVAFAACDDATRGTNAKITLSPTQHSFGSVPVGMRDLLTISISNIGGRPLDVNDAYLRAGSSAAYTLVVNLPLRIGPGERRELQLIYEPRASGTHSGEVVVASDDPMTPEATVALSTLDLLPRLVVDPPTIDFGLVEQGQAALQEVALRNDGTADLEILGARTSGDAQLSIAPLHFPLVIQAGQIASARMAFAPTRCGGADAVVELLSNDPSGGSTKIPLEGHTAGPSLRFSQVRYDFGTVRVGASAPATLTLKSRGTEPVTIGAIHLADPADGSAPGAASRFSLGGFPTPPFSLATGESIVIPFNYAPQDTTTTPARLVIDSNDCGGASRAATLIGRGTTSTAPPGCALAANPAALMFGAIVPTASRDLIFDLQSIGTGPCVFTGTEISTLNDRGFAVVGRPALGTTLPAGESAPFVVRFSPGRSGFREGRLRILGVDPSRGNDPVELGIQLTGRSGPATIDVSPSEIAFGLVRTGCVSKPAQITIANVGEAPLTLSRADVAVAMSPFEVIAPVGSLTLDSGARTSATLHFHPQGEGIASGAFVVESNDLASPSVAVALAGRGHAAPTVVDRLDQDEAPIVDMLFVVDNSGSMREEQAALEAGFALFAQRAVARRGRYQIGVVTTDTPTLRGSPSIVRSSSPDAEGVFRRNVRVGTSGSGEEKGLEMARRALSEPLSSTTNAGLLRRNAALELVFVSDEEDQSPDSVTVYLDHFRRHTTGRMRVSAIVGPPRGCSSATGDASPGTRYLDAVARTGGVSGSICAADFGTTLASIGETAFTLRDRVNLSGEPDPTQPITVRLYANAPACSADPEATQGTPLLEVTHWSYDPAQNAILFTDAGIPPENACALVKYTLACRRP